MWEKPINEAIWLFDVNLEELFDQHGEIVIDSSLGTNDLLQEHPTSHEDEVRRVE